MAVWLKSKVQDCHNVFNTYCFAVFCKEENYRSFKIKKLKIKIKGQINLSEAGRPR